MILLKSLAGLTEASKDAVAGNAFRDISCWKNTGIDGQSSIQAYAHQYDVQLQL